MTENADHRFSATLSSRDLALIGCLRALADFSQRNISRESTEEQDWRAAGQKVTFEFSRALDRDLFKNEVRRLLPANLVRFDAETDNDPARPQPQSSGFPLDRNNMALAAFDPPAMWREEFMSREIDEKAQKINNPQAEFDKPSDVVKDSELSPTEKKRALENLEQDAHQLMTASNEGMAPENDRLAEHEPKLDEVVKAQQRIGERPRHKPAQ